MRDKKHQSWQARIGNHHNKVQNKFSRQNAGEFSVNSSEFLCWANSSLGIFLGLLLLASRVQANIKVSQNNQTGASSSNEKNVTMTFFGQENIQQNNNTQSFIQIKDASIKTSPSAETLSSSLITPYRHYFKSKPVKEIPIRIHPHYQTALEKEKKHFLSAEGAHKQQAQADNLIQKIKKTIDHLPLNKEIFSHLQASNLTISIFPNSAFKKYAPDHLGNYVALTNEINFRNIPTTTNNLQHFLLNEFHHVAVTLTNYKKLKQELPITEIGKAPMPMLDEKGQIHLPHKNQLQIAHQQFKNNIENFITLHNKYKSKNLGEIQNKTYLAIRAAIVQFHKPLLFAFSMGLEEYTQVLATGKAMIEKDGSVIFPKQLVPALKYDIRIYPAKKPSEEIIGFATYAVYPHNDEDKITAFIGEYELHFLYGYAQGYYKQLPLEKKLTEYSSSIDSLAPEIKELLAPKWCEYFSEYHGVDNYCKYADQKIGI